MQKLMIQYHSCQPNAKILETPTGSSYCGDFKSPTGQKIRRKQIC